MKRTALVLLALVGLSSVLLAQKKTPPEVSKASIELVGVKLHLGMTKADVAERYVGTQVTKVSEDFWIIGKVGMSGTVRFKNEKLRFVERSWIYTGDDPIDSIYAAVSSLNHDGYFSCKVAADTLNNPVYAENQGLPVSNTSAERIWIVCGIKSVLISKMKIGDRPPGADVSERLGSFDVDSK
jgi:hypothetical protein